MKKKAKLILILAIAAAVLFAAGAYILVFRTNVTVDFYTSRGQSALESGRFQSAIRMYSAARKLDSHDPDIAIGLAKAYKGTGNYTKAEYTLVSAITQAPEQTSLYVALSHTYVEQEKFLDADLMLSRASNETVKAELEAMRPAAPTLTPESGYYSEYISVSASCPAGRIFLTTDGEYPSGEDDQYTEPVSLPGGETTICALVVDDSGLVSPVTYAGYTVAGVIEPVTITDETLNTILREAIGKPAEDELMSNELWSIEELQISGAVTDLSQMKYLTGLTSLKIEGIAATDFTALAALPKLTSLDLSGCVVSAASAEAIGKLTQLTELDLSGCALTKADAFTTLTKLNALDLSNNAITDVSSLSALTELTALSLKNNPVSDLSPLENCTKLETLDISSCEITDLKALAGMTALKELDASDNLIASIGALADCKALQKLLVSANEISDISILPALPSLSVFDGSHNSITKIPTFESGHPLQSFNLNYNGVTAVSGLQGLSALNYVMLDYNKVSDLTPLENCANLVQVDVWDNPVASAGVSALQEHSIIVNYNPNS